jgi:2-polyprenyl-3-methyl-5-hydroxy-6-metoxy-1,4-benzoquinol methylase
MERLAKEDYVHGGTQKDFYDEHEREMCNCPLCNGDVHSKLDSERGLSVVKCKDCDLIYVSPRAKNADKNYFGDAATFFNEAMLIFKGKKNHHRDKNYEYELKKIKRFKSTGRLLDVGTNMGFFLRKAQELGFETEGIEPSPSLSEIAREQWGLKIHTSFLENSNLSKNAYDVITLIDVFEHVTNPKELLTSCYSYLKSDGIVAIKVPNGDYNYFKMKLGQLTRKHGNMDIWDCCEHVVHYTPKTFRKMVESCGFKIKNFFVPIPIHLPIWANLVGHYYLYPSPFVLDWKRRTLRTLFYYIGRVEKILGGKIRFGPDLMFIIEKK